MVWHFLKYLTSFVLAIFYKRIQAKNIKNVQVDGPVIVAMNHPNAFTDPVAFTYVSYPTRLKYLARGDAFKPGFASFMLEQIGIVPIFRIQDGGKEGLKKNDEAYRRVNKLLKRNHKMIVFAEGLCIQERRLRPLKKGVARMVFGAYDYLNNDKLVIVPVGVNYSQPDKYRSTLFYNVGEPIHVKDFIDEYRNNPARAQNQLLQVLAPKMKELITHINNPENDKAVYNMETLYKRKMLKAQGRNYKNLSDDYEVTKQITELVNTAEIEKKDILDEFKTKSEAYLKKVRGNDLRDWLIDSERNYGLNKGLIYLRMLMVVLGYPIYILGVIGSGLAYKLTMYIVKKVIKAVPEFYSSMAIGIGMVLLWLTHTLWFFLVYAFSPNVLYPIVVSLALILAGWFSIHYRVFKTKTLGMLRASKSPALIKELSALRVELVSLINKF